MTASGLASDAGQKTRFVASKYVVLNLLSEDNHADETRDDEKLFVQNVYLTDITKPSNCNTLKWSKGSRRCIGG